MMALGIRHLPVMRGDKVVGMLSDRDILQNSYLKNGQRVVEPMKVAQVIRDVVHTCFPDSSISTVAEKMLVHGVHALPVVTERGKLVGIITSSDLLAILRDADFSRDYVIPFEYETPKSLSDIL